MKCAFEEELNLGDIVLVGYQDTQLFAVVRGFTDTGQVQTTKSEYIRRIIHWPDGSWYKYERDANGLRIGYNYGPVEYVEENKTFKYAKAMFKCPDGMLATYPNQEHMGRLRALQLKILEQIERKRIKANDSRPRN
jgi:hypothetical protein